MRPTPPVVLSLTYHEATEDPRVFKQAKALHAAGCDVTIFCLQKPGAPAFETVEGIKLRRFDCYGLTDIPEDPRSELDFLAPAEPAYWPRYRPVSAAMTRSRQLDEALRDTLDWLGLQDRAPIDTKGWDRTKARAAFAGRVLAGFGGRLGQRGWLSRAGGLLPLLAKRKLNKKRARRARRKLYQARAALFALNLTRQPDIPRPDIVHAHDIYTLAGGVALARRFGCRLIYDAHEIEIARASNMGPEGGTLPDAIERACFEDVSALITVSEGCAASYAARYTKNAPVIVMNAPEITPSGEGIDLRVAAGLPPSSSILVYTGLVLGAQRGLFQSVEALKHVPNLHLVILGPRHERNDAELMKYVGKLNLTDRVHLVPKVPADQVVPTISTANLAICPIQDASLSYRHAMPNKLFESAHARLPIVVSNLPDMRAFVEELGIGLAVDETDPKDIARGIQTILDAPEAYRPGDTATALLAGKYSWAAQVDTLLALYNRLLSRDIERV